MMNKFEIIHWLDNRFYEIKIEIFILSKLIMNNFYDLFRRKESAHLLVKLINIINRNYLSLMKSENIKAI